MCTTRGEKGENLRNLLRAFLADVAPHILLNIQQPFLHILIPGLLTFQNLLQIVEHSMQTVYRLFHREQLAIKLPARENILSVVNNLRNLTRRLHFHIKPAVLALNAYYLP